MTTQEVANRLVSLCRQGQIQQAGQELYGENIVSIEPPFAPTPKAEGIKAVVEKGERFASSIEAVHGGSISDPIISGNYFTVGWTMDITRKGMDRISLQEVCVYKVENGKIVWEEFFY
jgi:hypothetical protein